MEKTKTKKYNKLRVEMSAMATGMFYSAQEERINAFNRMRQIMYREVEGIDLTQKQEKKEKDDKSREKYTDAKLIKYINENITKLSEENREYVEKLKGLLQDFRVKENKYKEIIEFYLEDEPIYGWLKNIRGISTINAANLLQYFGYCEKAKHASSLWKYAGLHVIDGKAPKKAKGIGQLDWNPKLRTLMYRIGDCFVKHRPDKYREIYDTEKERQFKIGKWNVRKNKMMNGAEGAPKSKRHADLRARRKMMKAFLLDYYMKCLFIRGIKAKPPYSARFHPNEP